MRKRRGLGWEEAKRRFERNLPLDYRRNMRGTSPEGPQPTTPAWGAHLTLVALEPSEMAVLRAHWDRLEATLPSRPTQQLNTETWHVTPSASTK
jgi:hypothetical protein